MPTYYAGARRLSQPTLYEAAPAFFDAFTATRTFQDAGNPAHLELATRQRRIPAHFQPPEGYVYLSRLNRSCITLSTLVRTEGNRPTPTRVRVAAASLGGGALLGNNLRFRWQLPEANEPITAVMDIIDKNQQPSNLLLQLELTEDDLFARNPHYEPILEIIPAANIPRYPIDPAHLAALGLAQLQRRT